MSIVTLQLTTAFVWFIAAMFLVPGTYRAFFGTARLGDFCKSGFFFVAMVMVGACAGFLIRPGDVLTWKIMYGLSILTALYVLVIVWNIKRDVHHGS